MINSRFYFDRFKIIYSWTKCTIPKNLRLMSEAVFPVGVAEWPCSPAFSDNSLVNVASWINMSTGFF